MTTLIEIERQINELVSDRVAKDVDSLVAILQSHPLAKRIVVCADDKPAPLWRVVNGRYLSDFKHHHKVLKYHEALVELHRFYVEEETEKLLKSVNNK